MLQNTYTIFKVWTLLEFLNFFPQLTDVAVLCGSKMLRDYPNLLKDVKELSQGECSP
jgi:hypothetical protein